jgi:hypothetical protein
MSEVSRQREAAPARVLLVLPLQQFPGAVRRSVIDTNDLVVHSPATGRGAQPLEQLRQDGFFIEARNNDRNLLHDDASAQASKGWAGSRQGKCFRCFVPVAPAQSRRLTNPASAFIESHRARNSDTVETRPDIGAGISDIRASFSRAGAIGADIRQSESDVHPRISRNDFSTFDNGFYSSDIRANSSDICSTDARNRAFASDTGEIEARSQEMIARTEETTAYSQETVFERQETASALEETVSRRRETAARSEETSSDTEENATDREEISSDTDENATYSREFDADIEEISFKPLFLTHLPVSSHFCRFSIRLPLPFRVLHLRNDRGRVVLCRSTGRRKKCPARSLFSAGLQGRGR